MWSLPSKRVIALAVVSVGLGLYWVSSSITSSERLELYTTPALPATGKRVQLLVPVGWKGYGVEGGFIVEPARRYPWIQSSLLRKWFGLDNAEMTSMLIIEVTKGHRVEHVAAKPFSDNGVWTTAWIAQQDEFELAVAYVRSNKEAFDATRQAIRESTRIIDGP